MDKKILPIFYQQLTSFPFIEKDFDALTEYELIQALFEKINECVDLINQFDTDVSDFATKELVNSLYAELNTKIDNQINGVISYSDDQNYKLELRMNNKFENLENEIENIQMGKIQDVNNPVEYGVIDINDLTKLLNEKLRYYNNTTISGIDSVVYNNGYIVELIDDTINSEDLPNLCESLEITGLFHYGLYYEDYQVVCNCLNIDYYNNLILKRFGA